MKVFSAIVILSVLCLTSKAQHFCESLLQNNYEVMFYPTRGYPVGVFVIGDKYWRLDLKYIPTNNSNIEVFEVNQPSGSTDVFKDQSISFIGNWVSSLDGLYNPTKKTMDYIKYNRSGVNDFTIKRQDVGVKDPNDLLNNSTAALLQYVFPKEYWVLVAHSPNSGNESLISTYISVNVDSCDSNQRVCITFKADESQEFNQMFEYYSSNGYRLLGNEESFGRFYHQKKGLLVRCTDSNCMNGLKGYEVIIDCDFSGPTDRTPLAPFTTQSDISSIEIVSDLSTRPDGNTPDGHTPVGNSPQESFGTQSNGGGDVTRNPDPNMESSPKSTSFWMILLILLIIAGVVAVVIVSIVWFTRHSQQKSEKGVEAEAHKSAPKSSADGKNQSEVVSVRSQ